MSWLWPKTFISYRRKDSAGYSGRLQGSLVSKYGESQVFMDVTSLEGGGVYRSDISNAVGKCDVLVAMIGPEWADATAKDGRRRLDDPADLVRIEIAAALDRRVRVIPVLVGGAAMPEEDDLPEVLRPLRARHAVTLRDGDWDNDIKRLTRVIGRTRQFWLTGLIGLIAITATGLFITGRGSVMPAAGEYMCTAGSVPLRSCMVDVTGGDVRLTFQSPMHSDRDLIDRYAGTIQTTREGFAVPLRNEFNPDPGRGPGAMTTSLSSLTLAFETADTLRGVWTFADQTTQTFTMSRVRR